MKKLDAILEECIEAGLEGRRTLEQSLALYPAYAEELEPLLRTALSVSDAFQYCTPPAATERRIRERFLADAAARRNLRRLEGAFEKRGWLAGLFRAPVLGGFAAAAAVAIAAVAVTLGGVNLGSDGDGTTSVSGVQGPTVVLDLQAQVDSVSDKVNGGDAIESADLEEISRLLALLKNSSTEDLQASADELEAILPDTLDILTSASDDIPRAAGDQAVIDAIDTTVRDIAAVLDFDLPGPIAAGPGDTPEPTAPPATGAPTDAPEPTPVATGDATPVATATPEPVEAPTPTSTADDRAPPGFLP